MASISLTAEAHRTSFAQLKLQPADALLALIGLYAKDARPEKLDLGVGVYKDVDGRTPVLRAVKLAEEQLLRDQLTKSYIGPEGDAGFFNALCPIIFGDSVDRARIIGLQTPGGTGALRLGAELIARMSPDASIHIGSPTWANHPPIFAAAQLRMREYRHIDLAAQALDFDAALSALEAATPGDVALLHGSCHNPTGADFTLDQWEILAVTMATRGILPFVDIAYQGLGDGLDADASGLRIVARHCSELLLAYSCDKNFGLYRERVGGLFVVARTPEDANIVQSNLLSLARANWSMPPDHGAAVVRIILDSAELTKVWRSELEEMRLRLLSTRSSLAALDSGLAFMAHQKGMFSTLQLSPDQIRALREQHGVYMAGSGRIAITGLTEKAMPAFVAALAAVR